ANRYVPNVVAIGGHLGIELQWKMRQVARVEPGEIDHKLVDLLLLECTVQLVEDPVFRWVGPHRHAELPPVVRFAGRTGEGGAAQGRGGSGRTSARRRG